MARMGANTFQISILEFICSLPRAPLLKCYGFGLVPRTVVEKSISRLAPSVVMGLSFLMNRVRVGLIRVAKFVLLTIGFTDPGN
jgi:hypothetical protein